MPSAKYKPKKLENNTRKILTFISFPNKYETNDSIIKNILSKYYFK